MKIIYAFITAIILLSAVSVKSQQWMVYDTSNTILPNNYIMSIAIDNNQNKWIGTKYYGTIGFLKFDDTEWTKYDYIVTGLIVRLVGMIRATAIIGL